MMDDAAFQWVCQRAREAMVLQTSADVLEWDERTGMPPAAGSYRAKQVSALRAAVHDLRTDPKYGETLQSLHDSLDVDPHSDEGATITELYRDWDRDRKLPTELVQTLSQATMQGQQAWDAARRDNNFAAFRDSLQQIITLKRDVGERLREGTDRSTYEALLDEYEPDARVDSLTAMFDQLREPLVQLIAEIRESPRQPDLDAIRGNYELATQRQFSRDVCERIGFDFSRGRLDETSHPFCTTLGPDDCRILTRYDKQWLTPGLFGSMHEAGHGMYEQGLRKEWFGLPPGTYVSLGVHESQSRLWENQVGRCKAFWRWLYAETQSTFAPNLDDVSLDAFHFAINAVRPSLIRVEADEATYNLHIIIRFELERRLIEGNLQVDDLPDAWNDRYERDLGVRPDSDADGVLQDVHWSAGLFGYFPTYTIGNLAAAQLYDAAADALGDLPSRIEAGEFRPLLEWLNDHVHVYGRCYSGEALIGRATGKPLSAESLIRYLTNKFRPLYGLAGT